MPLLLNLRVALGRYYEASLRLGSLIGGAFWSYPSTDPSTLSQKTNTLVVGALFAHRSIIWIAESFGLSADLGFSAKSYDQSLDTTKLNALDFAIGMVLR
ncbi:MAG: hypothetical protein IPJ88_02395 [Myxococcales bacterium]|nr:MAG: hypothetical protein IPJ88_02395 [Myxococcales bacterium]